ncbi:hypothetical protein O988_09395 [Pseudogymnoascus sp. VKM F-3808]|nr:hypothetical protein O988_09395 [Pseudogymnoascus sp. VKM F-3808]
MGQWTTAFGVAAASADIKPAQSPQQRISIRHNNVDQHAKHRGQRQPSSSHSAESGWNTMPTPDVTEPDPEPIYVSPSQSDANSSIISAIHFMAPKVFHEAQLTVPRSNSAIPNDVAAYVGDPQQIRDMAIAFFSFSAWWMPIICRKRFFSSALNPLSPPPRELVLLALCMKLFCSPLPPNAEAGQTDLYKTAKRFYSELEASGITSIRVLQAALLIAIYEIGHAIYPAAYFTVGICARYGSALGLDNSLTDYMVDCGLGQSWLEIEEMRRVWWGVLILDRMLNFGCPSRCLATKDPTFDNYLPVDDELFLSGTAKPSDSVSISAGFHLKMGAFARIAQATYLLTQVFQSINSPALHIADPAASFKETTAQLRRTLRALVQATEEEVSIRQLAFCCQAAICYCGLLLLQDHYWQLLGICSTQDAYDGMFQETRSILESIWPVVSDLGSEMAEGNITERNLTLFLAQLLYQVTATATTIGQGEPDRESKERIDICKRLLQLMEPRWRVTRVYVAILNVREAAMTSANVFLPNIWAGRESHAPHQR